MNKPLRQLGNVVHFAISAPVVLALLANAGCTSGAAGTGEGDSVKATAEALVSAAISGTATGPSGPLAGVKINVNGAVQTAAFTDASGKYSFTLATGKSYSLSASLTGCTFSSTQNINNLQADQVANFAGTGSQCQGVAVVIGPAGPQGPVGPQGPAGPAGPTGATGAQGPAGPQGPAGATGAVGPQGLMGLQGLQGIQGLSGTPGPAGPAGATGPVGAAGPAGAQGPAGPAGPAGATGATGPAGDSADIGHNTGNAGAGTGATCTLGEILLTASPGVGNGTPAIGQTLAINQNQAIFALLGTTYGGDGITNFKLPDLRSVAPNNMTYMICTAGVFPSRL